jgi:Holliday junction resolvase RusA-like endonuclease
MNEKTFFKNELQHVTAHIHSYMKIKTFYVEPMGKPRMTQSDRWKIDPNHRDEKKRKRKCVVKYHAFKDALLLQAKGFEMPEGNYHLKFYLPMPASWNVKKKETMKWKPHQQKPDKDNLEKAFLDCLCKNDEKIWDGRVSKFWDNTGYITIEYLQTQGE